MLPSGRGLMMYAARPSNDGGSSSARLRIGLHRIADALGVPVAELREVAPSEGFAVDSEDLLRLWCMIDDPERRRIILNLVRRLAKDHDA